MKTVLYRWLALAALFLAPALAVAQDKPAVVVSVSSVSETLSDIVYITKVLGQPDLGKTVKLFGGAFTEGLDRTRPIGVFVSATGGSDFQAVIAVPTKDLKRTLEVFKEYIGEPRDAGDGIMELGTNDTFYLKESGTWAYVAQQLGHLKALPKDPSKLLGDLPTKYNIAAQLNVRNIPEEMRTWAVTEITNAFEQAADRNFGDDAQAQLQKKLQEGSLKNFTRLIEESDQITFGLGIDPASKVTFIETSITAVAA